MTGWTRCAIALAVAALVASATTPSFATTSSAATQWLSPEETAARRDALLKQMIARPNDLDLAFEYANLSSQAGDYTLDQQSVGREGWSALNIGALHYSFDLKQDDKIEFDALAYSTAYSRARCKTSTSISSR